MDDELDYLVGTQLETKPWSFSEVVREVFLLEHDCTQRQDIAAVLGVDKSRVSQMLGNPTALKPASIQGLLDCLASPGNRRRIVEAWMRECFGSEAPAVPPQTIGKSVSGKTIRRIDRQIREARLSAAATLSLEAYRRTDEPVLKEQLLDRAYFARQRLNEPGQAIGIARVICMGATRRNELLRIGAGHLMRVRVLRSLPDCDPNEIESIFSGVERLLILNGEQQPDQIAPYFLASGSSVESERVACQLAFYERGRVPLDSGALRDSRAQCVTNAKKAKSYQERGRQLQMASRISLLLGDDFQAAELLEQSFQAGSTKNLDAYEVAAILTAQILSKTEGDIEASKYLRKAISTYARSMNLHHRQIAEAYLARIESRQFPALP